MAISGNEGFGLQKVVIDQSEFERNAELLRSIREEDLKGAQATLDAAVAFLQRVRTAYQGLSDDLKNLQERYDQIAREESSHRVILNKIARMDQINQASNREAALAARSYLDVHPKLPAE